MKEVLIKKLHTYLVQNNPDVLVVLQGGSNVTSYLEEKVNALDDLTGQLLAEGKASYIIEEICMDVLTEEFRPSRYNYLISILEDEFRAEYTKWLESGILTYEIINLLQACNPVFDYLGFMENEDDRRLRYAIIGTVQKCLAGVIVEIEDIEKLFSSLATN